MSTTEARDVVFLHGWGQHGGVWDGIAQDLPEGFRPTAFDLPGHGKSAWQAPWFELDALVDALAANAPGRCHLVGWSLGAMLALRWAQRHPQQVARMVLIAATPCFTQRADWAHGTPVEVQQAFAERVAAAPDRALQSFADLMADGESDARGVRRALRHLLAAAPLVSADALAAGLDFLAAVDLRHGLLADPPQQPTLLIHGEEDTITPIAASRWLARTLQAREISLTDCGHAPMMGHGAEVSAAIAQFLTAA